MESWRSTTKYIIDASGYRFPLPINNLQFSFPNLIIFLKLAECTLSIDSECYCLMSDFFFAPYSCFLVAPETLVLTNPFHFSLQII